MGRSRGGAARAAGGGAFSASATIASRRVATGQPIRVYAAYDGDGDRIPDAWWELVDLDPADPAADADADGVANAAEFWTDSDPRAADSNADGRDDGDDDFDRDGLRNALEAQAGTLAWAMDSD